MTPEERMVIEWQCARVAADVYYYADHGQFDEVERLFAPDATLHRLGGVTHGAAEIAKSLGQRPAGWVGRHVIVNVHFGTVTATSAEATAYVTAFFGFPPIDGGVAQLARDSPRIVDVDDVFTRVDERWVLQSRRTTHVLVSADDR